MSAGRFVETVVRCFYQLDTGTVTTSQGYPEVKRKLESTTIPHSISAKDRSHLIRVMDLIYEFRSDRGVVHISSIHNANQVDSMLVIHTAKWLLSELIRITSGVDDRAAGEFVSRLGQMEHPIVHEVDGRPLVLVTGLTAAEEILLLLNHTDQFRLPPSELSSLVSHIKRTTVASALKVLSESRQIRKGTNGDWVLTPSGQGRVLESIVPKVSTARAA